MQKMGAKSFILIFLLLRASCHALLTATRSVPMSHGVASSVPLSMLTDPNARCMDGTLSGYYYQPASNATVADKFIFFLEGGGECASQTACYANLNSALGSSKYFQPQISMPYFLTDDATSNPDFHDWNHINVPYCSQDLHSGQRNTTSNETWGLYFSGHHVFTAILDELDDKYGLQQASEIILTGASAGGIGVWMNLDYLAQRYPKARVTGVPIAGFYFFAYPYTGPNYTQSYLADFREAAWPQHYELYQAFTDEDCAKQLQNPWSCMLANYSFPYVTTPTYVVEAQTDQVVLEGHDWLPGQDRHLPPEQQYMHEWQSNMTQALSPLMLAANSKNGVFNPACYIHTTFDTTAPLIRGLSYLDGFSNWYFNRTGYVSYKLQDDCGLECNPTCP